MTGYELTEKLRKARRRHLLSAPTQALYYELVAICNEEGWKDVFNCSNDELFRAIRVSEKSLIAYRQELIQSGLIFYKSGKSKKSIGLYSFVKNFDGCKIYNQSDSQSVNQSGSQYVNQSDYQSGGNASDNNKLKEKEKLKLNKKESKSHSETKVPVIEEIEVLLKKTENEIYKELVAVWFDYYRKHFSTKPTFGSVEGSKMKSIERKLKSKCEEFNQDWNEVTAGDLFVKFLDIAMSDKWLKENYQLSILDSKFDSIIVKALKHASNQNSDSGILANW